MNKRAKKLLVLFSIFIAGTCFGVGLAQAQNNQLVLETSKECNIQYAGSSCVGELVLTNNTGRVLDGKAILEIGYQGICGDGPFSGQGIQARFSVANGNRLAFSGWKQGKAMVSNFNIPEGRTALKIGIETHPALCPGRYSFALSMKGTFERQEYIVVAPVIVRWGYVPPIPEAVTTITITSPPTVTSDSATISYTTDIPSFCRVIYDDASHPILGNPPNYGYNFSTEPPGSKTTSHEITLVNLNPGTTYYYRVVCWASPQKISVEYSFTTLRVREEGLIPAEEIVSPREERPIEEEIPVPEEIVGPPEEPEEIEKIEEIEEEVPEEIVPPEEEIVIVPIEERVQERDFVSMLSASLALSLQGFLDGQFFNNLIFWIIIAVLGILLYGLSLIKKPRMFFRALGFIGVFGLLIATLLLPLPIINQLRMPLPNFISYPLGILLFVGGILIMFFAIKALYFKTASGIDEAKKLVTWGLYGIVRHPLYLGLIIAYLGWCIIFKALPALLMAPIVFVFLWILTIFEERDLLKTFGENYIQYRKKVFKRIIPGVV